MVKLHNTTFLHNLILIAAIIITVLTIIGNLVTHYLLFISGLEGVLVFTVWNLLLPWLSILVLLIYRVLVYFSHNHKTPTIIVLLIVETGMTVLEIMWTIGFIVFATDTQYRGPGISSESRFAATFICFLSLISLKLTRVAYVISTFLPNKINGKQPEVSGSSETNGKEPEVDGNIVD